MEVQLRKKQFGAFWNIYIYITWCQQRIACHNTISNQIKFPKHSVNIWRTNLKPLRRSGGSVKFAVVSQMQVTCLISWLILKLRNRCVLSASDVAKPPSPTQVGFVWQCPLSLPGEMRPPRPPESDFFWHRPWDGSRNFAWPHFIGCLFRSSKRATLIRLNVKLRLRICALSSGAKARPCRWSISRDPGERSG